MNELELLEQLQTIQNKLKNNEELTDQEYKLFATIVYASALGIIETSLKYVLSLFGDPESEGDNDE